MPDRQEEFKSRTKKALDDIQQTPQAKDIRDHMRETFLNDKVFTLAIGFDIAINATDRGIVLCYKGEPIFGCNEPAEAALFGDAFAVWAMARIAKDTSEEMAFEEMMRDPEETS